MADKAREKAGLSVTCQKLPGPDDQGRARRLTTRRKLPVTSLLATRSRTPKPLPKHASGQLLMEQVMARRSAMPASFQYNKPKKTPGKEVCCPGRQERQGQDRPLW